MPGRPSVNDDAPSGKATVLGDSTSAKYPHTVTRTCGQVSPKSHRCLRRHGDECRRATTPPSAEATAPPPTAHDHDWRGDEGGAKRAPADGDGDDDGRGGDDDTRPAAEAHARPAHHTRAAHAHAGAVHARSSHAGPAHSSSAATRSEHCVLPLPRGGEWCVSSERRCGVEWLCTGNTSLSDGSAFIQRQTDSSCMIFWTSVRPDQILPRCPASHAAFNPHRRRSASCNASRPAPTI